MSGGGVYLCAAEQANERRDFDSARDHLTPYLAAYPDSGPGHFLAGRVDAAPAISMTRSGTWRFVVVFTIVPRPSIWSDCCSRWARGQTDTADYLRELVEQKHADSLLILEVLIDFYLRDYRLFDGLWGLTEYLAQRPDDVPALLGRAFVWEKIFSFADAETDYRQALAIDPNNEGARRRFAELPLECRGTPDEAAAEYQRLRERHPDEPAYILGQPAPAARVDSSTRPGNC